MKILSVLFLIFYSTISMAKIINIPSDQKTIQEGINIADSGDTVIVQPGTYSENINFQGKSIVVSSLYVLMKDDRFISNTIIHGKEQCSVVTFENKEKRETSLIGFTIQNGKDDWSGGGIYCEQSSPTLKHLIIKDNQASGGGGIFCINESSPYLQNVLITGNSADKGGGMMTMSNSNPVLVNVTITGNDAAQQGDGLICCGSQPFILNSIITDSICCAGWSEKSTYVISHSNITQGYLGLVQYENLELFWLDGNIQGDPGFVDQSNQDFRLHDCSTGIDKGNIEFVWMGKTIFSLSEDEYYGKAPDIGAFEFISIIE